jgi:hypothetical protein
MAPGRPSQQIIRHTFARLGRCSPRGPRARSPQPSAGCLPFGQVSRSLRRSGTQARRPDESRQRKRHAKKSGPVTHCLLDSSPRCVYQPMRWRRPCIATDVPALGIGALANTASSLSRGEEARHLTSMRHVDVDESASGDGSSLRSQAEGRHSDRRERLAGEPQREAISARASLPQLEPSAAGAPWRST